MRMIGVLAVAAMTAFLAAPAAAEFSHPYWSPGVESPIRDGSAARTRAPRKVRALRTAERRPKEARAKDASNAIAKAEEHRLILQVNTNDATAMNLALNNASNVVEHFKKKGDAVKIEIVTFGPGLHMLRSDTSPVKSRIEEMALGMPEVAFKACGNTRDKMRKAEDKEVPLVPEAKVVESGVVRVMELQEAGWTYVKP